MTGSRTGIAAAVVVLIAGWALSAFVSSASVLAPILLIVGAIALAYFVLTTTVADRLVWRPLARRLQGKLGGDVGGPAARSSALQAANRLLAELQDCSSRLGRWHSEGPGWWSDLYLLPVNEWEELRGELAGDGALGETWPSVSLAYREIDHVNRLSTQLLEQAQIREQRSLSFVVEEGPTAPLPTGLGDLARASDAVERAEHELGELVPRLRSWTGQPRRG